MATFKDLRKNFFPNKQEGVVAATSSYAVILAECGTGERRNSKHMIGWSSCRLLHCMLAVIMRILSCCQSTLWRSGMEVRLSQSVTM